MSEIKIGTQTPKQIKDTVYLHLRPKSHPFFGTLEGMTVVKAAKSTDAAVTPGDFIVKIEVVVPPQFFIEAMPSARIELDPSMVVPIILEQTSEDDA